MNSALLKKSGKFNGTSENDAKMCTLLHRSKLNILPKYRFGISAILIKTFRKKTSLAKSANVANFQNISQIIL